MCTAFSTYKTIIFNLVRVLTLHFIIHNSSLHQFHYSFYQLLEHNKHDYYLSSLKIVDSNQQLNLNHVMTKLIPDYLLDLFFPFIPNFISKYNKYCNDLHSYIHYMIT